MDHSKYLSHKSTLKYVVIYYLLMFVYQINIVTIMLLSVLRAFGNFIPTQKSNVFQIIFFHLGSISMRHCWGLAVNKILWIYLHGISNPEITEYLDLPIHKHVAQNYSIFQTVVVVFGRVVWFQSANAHHLQTTRLTRFAQGSQILHLPNPTMGLMISKQAT